MTSVKSNDPKRLKVLQVGPLPPPVGGMAAVVENLISALQTGCEIRVLNNQKTTALDRTLWQGILAQLWQLWQLAELCVQWRPQIVHIHTCSWFTFWRNLLDVVIAKLFVRKVVLHIHGGQFHKFLDSLNYWQRKLARAVFHMSDQVIVLGDEWSHRLSKWCPPEKLCVIPNGVPVPELNYQQRDGCIRILCLANYAKNKGQEDLIRAVAQMEDNKLLRIALLGPEAEPGQQEVLYKLADELGLANQVVIPGPKMGAEKQVYLEQTDIFCLPSYDEGLPMSMLEAMAVGIPVVMTRVGAIPEVVTDGLNGCLYNPGDLNGLTQCLEELIANPECAKRMGAAGYERVKKEYSIEVSATRTLEMYRKLEPCS